MLILMWLGCAIVLYGQVDTVRQSQQPAVREHDALERLTKPEVVKEDRIEVEKSELPEPLLHKLENDTQYDGWEEGTVYLEKNTNEYLLHVTQRNTTRTYRFDEFGNALDDTVPAETSRERIQNED